MNLIDTHVDTITTLIDRNQNLLSNTSHVSLEKLNQYDKKGIYFAIWLSEKRRKNPLKETLKAIDFYYDEIDANKSLISHTNNYSDFITTFNEGRVASLLGIEGGESLQGDIENLFLLYNKGIRLLTLTWNNDNELGCGALGSEKGLSPFGKEIVNLTNELNIVIDVSHLNKKGFYDVINLTQKPILASHSNCYTIRNSKRNLFDEQLQELKNISSYVSFTLHTPFICDKELCTITDLLFHIDYLINYLGEDFVSIGTDFDGTNFFPSKINNISDLYTLYNLIEKTYNTVIADKLFYKNQLNFLRHIL